MQGAQSCCFHQPAALLPSTAAVFGQLLPQQSGAVWFWMLPSDHGDQLSSGIHYLPCFGRCLITSPPLSAFAPFPMLVHWEFGTETLAPCPIHILQGKFSIPPPLPTVSIRLQFPVYVFQFYWRFHSAQGLCCLCSQRMRRGSMECMMFTCSSCQFTSRQVWSQWWWGEMVPTFLSAAWHGEAF
jgi:hypothetical protein